MAFGTSNLQYGAGYGDDEFGIGGEGYSSLTEGDAGFGSQFGGSIYDEYYSDAIVSDAVDVKDYIYTYDPLKEQNLLADYMSSLVDMGDKTEQVRQKAISERKALSKGIRGGLTTGTMMEMEEEAMDAASRAQAGLYRTQASKKRTLGEDIGALREAYEGDMADAILDYNEKVGGSGATYGEMKLPDGSLYPGSHHEYNYRNKYGLDVTESGADYTNPDHVVNPTKEERKPTNDMGRSNGDTIFERSINDILYYKDEGLFYDGHWRRKAT